MHPKEEPIDRRIQKTKNAIIEAFVGLMAEKNSILRMFEYLEQHAFFYSSILTNKGIPAFRNRLLDMALNSLREQIYMSGINQNMNNELLVQFLSSAAVGVIEWWITHSKQYPAKDMVDQFRLLLERIQMVLQP